MAAKYAELQQREWLQEHYVVRGLPVSAIAEIVGCKYETVRGALEKHGIPRRPRGHRKGAGTAKGSPPVVAVGERYGILTILVEHSERGSDGGRRYVVRCDCGTEVVASGSQLKAGKRTSCGCQRRAPRLDLRRFPELWDAEWLTQQYSVEGLGVNQVAQSLGCSPAAVIKHLRIAKIEARPAGPTLVHGHALAERNSGTYRSWIGMKVRCYNPRWVGFHHYGGRGITVCDRWRNSFENFLEDMGERPEGKTVDRIDVDGNYEPSNCRWATQSEQLRNRRPYRRKAA